LTDTTARVERKEPRVWLDLDQAELDAAYDQSVWAPNRDQIIKRYASNSDAVRARLGAPRRYAYGATPIEALDVYVTTRAHAPINVFIHGGAWRAGLAGNYAFPAELFVRAGAHFVVPDFAAVQDVGGSLMPMAAQVRGAIAWVKRNAHRFGGDPDRIYVSGHSSGAHLAGVILTTDWRRDFDLPADTVKGGLCSSGMYDLKPVRLSARNAYVKFTDEMELPEPSRHASRPGHRLSRHARVAGVPAPGARLRCRADGGRQAGPAPGRRRVQPLRDDRNARHSRRPPGPRDARADEALSRRRAMKAAILYKANTPLEVVDVQQQGPQAGEARVKVMAAGVCHSDWHIMNGDWTLPLPMVLGHEAAGIVDEVGAGVGNVRPGDHVIFSFRPQCGRCLYCSIGRSILCDGHQSARWMMLDGSCRLKRDGQDIFQMARIGTFAESVVCPAEMLVPIRKEMPWPQAALMGCCVPTGVGAVTRCAEVEAGASVVVIGCGGVGLNVVQGARLAGARLIVACDLLANKLDYAREFGATHTINATSQNVVEQVRALTGGRGADYAFDAIGGEATTLQIIDAIRPGGTAVIVGMAAMNVRAPITPYMMALQEKTLRGTMYGSVRPNIDFPRLVDLYLDGRLKIDQLVSRTYKLAEINEGFAALRSGQVARGVVVF